MVGIEVQSGKALWTIPFPDLWNENIVTPVVAGDILIVSGARKGTYGYRLEKTGAGFAAAEVWHNTDLPMHMSSPVVDGTFVYGFGSRRKGQLFCLDARTGVAKWTTEGRGGTNASIQMAGPNLVVLTTDGELLVVRRSPDKYEELKRYKVAESETWAQPVLVPGGILIRDAVCAVAFVVARQIPNPKLQIPTTPKSQRPTPLEPPGLEVDWDLGLGVTLGFGSWEWLGFGAWDLGFDTR